MSSGHDVIASGGSPGEHYARTAQATSADTP